MSCHNDAMVKHYEYDSFGNCTVYDGNGTKRNDGDFIGNINPFRWKSFYYDAETGLYYANGSYYDSKTGLYVDASPVSAVFDNVYSTRSLDRNAPVCNNILELAGNPSTAFTETELSPDPKYNFEDTLPDWLLNRRKRQQKLAEVLKWYQDLHWGWKLGIGIGLLIGAITFTALSGGGWLGALGVVAQVAIGVGVGVGLYALGALFGFNEFSLEGLGNAALDSFLASSAIAFISSGVSFIKHLARSRNISSNALKDCINQCFIAGTLIHCEDGLKKIEDVQVGDKVLAYNEETGEQAYKTVLHLFRNESKDWTGITVNDKEIVSTPGHKYYLPLTKQWVSAKDLKVGDTVLLSNGQLAKVQKIRSIHYDTPQTTYNFEVEDFHTYYVETGVLVHNKNCETKLYRAMSDAEYGSLTKHGRFKHKLGTMQDKFMATSIDDAITWGNKMMGEGNFMVVEIRVSTSSLQGMQYYNYALDGIGKAYSAHYTYLNKVMLGFRRVI